MAIQVYQPPSSIDYSCLVTWLSDTTFEFDGGLWETKAKNRNKGLLALLSSSRCVEGSYNPNIISYLFIYKLPDGGKNWIITKDKHWKKHPTVFSLARKRYDLLYLTQTQQFKEILDNV